MIVTQVSKLGLPVISVGNYPYGLPIYASPNATPVVLRPPNSLALPVILVGDGFIDISVEPPNTVASYFYARYFGPTYFGRGYY